MNSTGDSVKLETADNVKADNTVHTDIRKKKLFINQGIFSLGHFIIDVYMNLLPPILPLISKDMGLSLALAATVLSAKTITSSFFQPYLGYLLDRKQNKWLLPLSIIWVSVTMGLVGVVDNYYLLLLISALSGIGSAVYHPLGSAYSNIFADANKGLAVSIFTTGGSLGIAAGPAIVVPVVLYFGLKGTMLLMIPGLAVAVLFVLFNIYYLEETDPVIADQQMATIDEKVPGGNNGRYSNWSLRVSTLKEKLSVWNINNRLKAVIILSVIVILRSIVHAGMAAFLPYYFLDIGYSDLVGGRLLSLYLLFGALAGIYGGYISDRYGRKIVTVISMAAAALLILVFINTTGAFSLVILLLSGGVLLLSLPVTIIYAQELIPESKGFASGLMMGLCYGIAGLTITPLGMAADLWGLDWVMVLFSIILVAGALLFLMISRLSGDDSAG